MKQEPIAWIKKREIGYMEVIKRYGAKDYGTNLGLVPEDDDIPLYTAPQLKELSDEEIYKTIFESGFDEDLFMKNLNKGDVPISLVLAKAILKKASEK
jgi:hypothetical protein